MARWLHDLDRAVVALVAAARWLVLPVSFLLFAQWPLRDVVHDYSVQANDLAQWQFAFYVSVALTFATRARAHLAADTFAHRFSPVTRRWIARIGAMLCVAPWSLFILIVAAPWVWQSVSGLERYADTFDPLYFIIKIAMWLLALLVFLQAMLDFFRPAPPGPA